MRRGTSFIVRTLPLAALLPLVWLMVGCVYVPWVETSRPIGANCDFRKSAMASSDELSTAERRLTKEQVVGLIGEPGITSANGRVWAYTLQAQHGFWVRPFPPAIGPAGEVAVALGLRFDADGLLEHQKLAAVGFNTFFYLSHDGNPAGSAMIRALDVIDDDNGVMIVPDWAQKYSPGRVTIRRESSVVDVGVESLRRAVP